MFNLHADVDARTMTPSRNTRSYTLRGVPSSPGRSFLTLSNYLKTHNGLQQTSNIHSMSDTFLASPNNNKITLFLSNSKVTRLEKDTKSKTNMSWDLGKLWENSETSKLCVTLFLVLKH